MSSGAKKLIVITGYVTRESNTLIELNWCMYDVMSRESKNESTHIINPSNIERTTDSEIIQLKANLLSFEITNKLENVLTLLNNFIEEELDLINKKFSSNAINSIVIVFNNLEIKNNLISSYNYFDIKYSKAFDYSINIVNEFLSFYNIKDIDALYSLSNLESLNNNKLDLLNHMLNYYNLNINLSKRDSITELNSIVRIINKMCKDNHKFIVQNISLNNDDNNEIEDDIDYRISQDNELKTKKSNSSNLNLKNKDISNIDNLSITKSYIENKDINNACSVKDNIDEMQLKSSLCKAYYIKLECLPFNYLKKPLINIINQYNVEEEDIEIFYDLYGNYTNNCIFRVYDECDYNELLSFLNL